MSVPIVDVLKVKYIYFPVQGTMICLVVEMSMNLNASTDELSAGAKQVLKVVDRLSLFNG